jgi:GNAT superfamily N-acetyltransferase
VNRTDSVEYRISPVVSNEALGELFASAWDGHVPNDFAPLLERSLLFVCAFRGPRLVGFVKVVSDAGAHAFLLDTTVHQQFQRNGIGRELVTRAVQESRMRGCEWVHVDFEPHLEGFYRACGFGPTRAGLLKL